MLQNVGSVACFLSVCNCTLFPNLLAFIPDSFGERVPLVLFLIPLGLLLRRNSLMIYFVGVWMTFFLSWVCLFPSFVEGDGIASVLLFVV